MSNPGHAPDPVNPSEDQPVKGPNLTLIYSLLGLAFLVAMVLAALIVLPFYQRR